MASTQKRTISENSSEIEKRGSFFDKFGSSLVGISIIFPIFVSAVTICFYLTPRIPFLWLSTSNLYAPVCGFLFACIVWFLAAFFYRDFATPGRANMHVYGMLARYKAELKARLSIEDPNNDRFSNLLSSPAQNQTEDGELSSDMVEKKIFDNEAEYVWVSWRKAQNAFCDLEQHLSCENGGMDWISGTGYIHAWRMIHRIQEALLGVQTTWEIIGEAMHDARAIQNSGIPDSVFLVGKLLRAVKTLSPDAMVYFDDLKGDRNFANIFKEDDQNIARSPSALSLLWKVFRRNKQEDSSIGAKKRSGENSCSLKEECEAREALRQVKHALNSYQDSLWSALVRARNYLSVSVVVVGFVTHLLLCIAILMGPTPDFGNSASTSYRFIVAAAAAYYIVGVVSGLFGHLYNETNSNHAPDDYGLFLSRLIATLSLSGLAGIGGVLLANQLLHGGETPALNQIFDGTLPIESLLAASVFGFAPSLIMAGLNQRIQKYATNLQNTKGEVTKAD